jgi:hypothetical protein
VTSRTMQPLPDVVRMPRARVAVRGAAVAVMLVLAGCAAQTVGTPSGTAGPTTSPPATATPLPIIGATCSRDKANDACLGFFAAGTQSSVLFEPRITFDIPAGWFNHADSPGEYVLFAPGSYPNASEFGARDWIAFEANVTLTPEGCGAQQQFDPSATAADIAAWMAGRANLVTTSPRSVSIGGLDGVTVDVRLADNAPIECFPVPAVLLVHGLPPSTGYDQAILAGTAMRFYFFDRREDVLMIEIDDVSGGDRLDEFAAVVNTVRFGS